MFDRIQSHERMLASVMQEWGFAKDSHGQHIYMERWEAVDPTATRRNRKPCMAIRRRKVPEKTHPDAILIVIGDQFAYIRGRDPELKLPVNGSPVGANLTQLVDHLAANPSPSNRATIENLLSLVCCCGHVTKKGWIIRVSTHPWLQNTVLSGIRHAQLTDDRKMVQWDGALWDVFENSFQKHQLQGLFGAQPSKL